MFEGESNGAEGRSGFAELGDLDPGRHRHEPVDLPLQRATGVQARDALAVSLAARRSLAKGGVHESLV